MRFITSFFLLTYVQLCNAAVETNTAKNNNIPSLTNEPVGLGNYLQMFFGLFIIVALIIGMAWFMRRMSSMSGVTTGNLKVLGGVSVGQRERVVLVQAGDTQLLVGVAPGEVRTLHVMDEKIVNTESSHPGNVSGFADKLHAAIKKRSTS